MKIVVCVKQVPDTETRIKVAPEGNAIVEAEINWIISPFDEFAIEEALKLKEAKGGEVVVVSIGPERVQTAVRSAFAMGADSGVHVKTDDLGDPMVTAEILAAAVRTLAPFDLILTGQLGVGGDHSQVPGILAELLDLPQITVAVKIDLQDGKAIVEREIEGGREVWETSLPAVISAQKGLNEPRYASLKGIMAAKKKPIKALSVEGLSLSGLRPRTKVIALELPPPRPPIRMIEGDPDAQVKGLLRLLHEEAKVI